MNANFEKYAREKLAGHEMAIDTDALWANVEPHVRQDKGNKKILWFFLLGLAVGLAGFGIFYFNSDSSKAIVASDEQSNPNSTDDVKAAPITDQLVEKEIIATTNSNDSNSSALNNAAVKKENKVDNKTTKEAIINRSSPKTKYTAPVQSTGTKSAKNGSSFSPNSNDLTNRNTVPLSSGGEMAKVIISEDDTPIDHAAVLSGRDLQVVSRLSSLYPKALSFNSQRDTEIPTDLLEAYGKTLEEYKASLKNQKKSRKPDFFRDMKFGVGIYAGIGQSTPKITSKNESATDFLVARTNSEKQLETLNLGFNALIETDKNLYMRTGLEYTRIASLFSRESELVTFDSVPGIVEIQINPFTGDTVEIDGNVLVTRRTQYEKKSYNYFHLVDVPIIFGYNFGNDEWKIGVEAGIYANVYLKNKGDIGLADETFYDIGSDDSGWYKSNIGISPFFGINGAYNVSENIQFHFSPGVRLNSLFTTDKSPLKEQHASLGVRAGVRYFFD